MIILKRSATAAAVLLFAGQCLLAEDAGSSAAPKFDNPLLADVVEMTREEVPDATILAYVRARRARLEAGIEAADLIRLHRADVDPRIIEYIASVAGIEEPAPGGERRDREIAISESESRDDDRAESASTGEDEVVPYPEPYRSVYDPWPGWYGPYWGPYGWGGWGGTIIFRGGRGHHGGGHHGGHHGGGRGGGHRGH